MGISISGTVVGGNKIGRLIGFPTANIVIENDNPVINGVYAAKITLYDAVYRGMANIGIKPSVSSEGKRVLEVNIFDFSENIYGQEISVELSDFIREEKKFSSIEELRLQIAQDKEKILKILK